MNEIAFKRLEIIKFFAKYGACVTRDAFAVARAKVYLWKKKFRESGGKIESLIPKSIADVKRKQREWHSEIIEFKKRKGGNTQQWDKIL